MSKHQNNYFTLCVRANESNAFEVLHERYAKYCTGIKMVWNPREFEISFSNPDNFIAVFQSIDKLFMKKYYEGEDEAPVVPWEYNNGDPFKNLKEDTHEIENGEKMLPPRQSKADPTQGGIEFTVVMWGVPSTESAL